MTKVDSSVRAKKKSVRGVGALVVVGAAVAAAPGTAHADAVTSDAPSVVREMGTLASTIIAHLLQHRAVAQAKAESCVCMRAGNGKGGPMKIACGGAEEEAARRAGQLIKTCSR